MYNLKWYYRRLVQRLFHHFYREFAWSYDGVAWLVSGGLWRRWVLTALPHLHGPTLELGFGPGHLQLALADRAACVGLDASPQMAQQAARRLRCAGYTPRLVRGLAQALPFADASFATVVATFPTEYIAATATQKEIRRVLRPNGRLVIIPSAELQPSVYRRLIDLAYLITLMRGTPSAMPNTITLGTLVLQPTWVTVGPSRVLLLEAHFRL
ncbi:hypothetical protein CJ255_12055 [Candidatus Viridilinea mediisalina]|uniref:Methyltransferase type 11 domain-containing protein n=1 Tax=Candidatus Viridilinea mediisalina TaxID=2024553 RepID=A0A2A6RIW4_9CHLR|nr:hypothetical protein CJ255_12055 [Candidatus Viridilinea mediisalina]